jgi:patatin-like phospholipase/acyl hydrolase
MINKDDNEIIELPFKILSIDGGGVKGLFSAEILAGLEEHYGRNVSDYFDMICGTSTGGLIALALAVKKPASEIVEFYKNEGPKIFPHKYWASRAFAFCKQVIWGAKYSNAQLRESLDKVFGDKKMCDAVNQLCIPSYNLTIGRPTVLKSPFYVNNVNKWCNDEQLRMTDVALATSAAPTYFPVIELSGKYYTDGGVWANNPTLCGITEAFKYFINKEFLIDGKRIKYTSVQVLSIASVNQPSGWSLKRRKNRSALLWLKGNKLLQPFMEGQSYYTDFFMKTLSSSFLFPINYKRITHSEQSVERYKNIDLDKATDIALKELSALGKDIVGFYRSSQESEVAPFFETLKSYKNIKYNGELSQLISDIYSEHINN